jgi:hypothetical protein
MQHAIAALQAAKEVAETNEPINRAEGNTDQADLELIVAQECGEAIEILENA